ncbi:MAG TPA: hypothetical protein VGO11_06660 [Chthoniobacteraceae bacterium]|jgi:hypothetical protein|nr:hypothetical protein [Chthoniobacteraceae bacterium]
MQNFLTLTLPVKQDAATLAKAKALVAGFSQQLQPKVEKALSGSAIVHFARFVLIGTEYIQVLTTYDGDERAYAVFFWNELNEVFKAAYELVEGAPTGADWTEENFFAFNKLPAHQPVPFYKFSAYPDKTVKIINSVA